jgi:hypothetical protein
MSEDSKGPDHRLLTCPSNARLAQTVASHPGNLQPLAEAAVAIADDEVARLDRPADFAGPGFQRAAMGHAGRVDRKYGRNRGPPPVSGATCNR